MWLFGLDVSTWIFSLMVLLIATYLYVTWEPNVWRSQGIPGPFIYPVIGSAYTLFKKGLRDDIMDNYNKYGKVFGCREGQYNTLYVADEDMLKEILVKNFSNFANRKILRVESDPISQSMLTSLQDNDWRRVRYMLTPSFSTGKLKMMVASIQECVQLLDETIGAHCDQNREADVRQILGAYTMDVIARVGFGIQVNTQKEQEESDFVRLGRKAFAFSLFRPLILLFFLFPWALRFAKHFNATIFDKEVLDFFVAHLRQTIQSKKEGQTKQKDFLQLMLDAHKEDVDKESIQSEVNELGGVYDHADPTVKKGLTENEILGQGFLFFVAGYETTAHTLTMLAHSLARHPHCQEKLHQEIINNYVEQDEVDYHAISKLPYLNMCVDETLRLYPPAARVDRVAGSDTTVRGIRVAKGSAVSVPIVAIHHDPDIYPEPLSFRPERFTAEAKAARSPFHYMPFGYGPRNCIGMRLAQMEIQMAAIHLIKRYKFSTCARTEYPIEFQKLGVIVAKNKIWLKVERRSDVSS